MTVSSSAFDNINKKKLYSGKKKRKKKGKKEKSAMPDEKESKTYQEQITDRSFVMDESDWEEAADDLAFDDIRSMVEKAVSEKYKGTNSSGGQPSYYSSRYFVYKLWPDKVVLKRSYNNNKDDLFLMVPYDIVDDVVVLGTATPVSLGFVPQTFQSDEFMVAMREADSISIDDPEFAKSVVESEEEEEDDDPPEDESEEDDESEGEDEESVDDEEDEESEEEDDEEKGASADMQEASLREDVDAAKVVDISESYAFNAIDGSSNIIEASDGSYIIKNMSLLGAKSKNNRSYSKEVRKNAIKVFEGIRAYCNHPAKGKEDDTRMIQELIGRHKNVRFDEATDMLRGDLHLSPTDTVKNYIIPHARTNPEIIGNSINASGKLSEDGTNVLEITKGRSIDIVSDPATTNGIYESVQSGKQSISEGGKDDMEITKDAVMKEAKLVEELRAHFREEFEVEGSVGDIQEENQSLKEEIEELKNTIKEYELQESIAEAKAEVEKLLKESKLPEDIKEDLRDILESAEGEDARKEIIARFEKVAESATKASKVTKGNGRSPSMEYTKNDEGDKLTESALVSRVASAFMSRR